MCPWSFGLPRLLYGIGSALGGSFVSSRAGLSFARFHQLGIRSSGIHDLGSDLVGEWSARWDAGKVDGCGQLP